MKLRDSWFQIVVCLLVGLQYATLAYHRHWLLFGLAVIAGSIVFISFATYSRRHDYYRRWYLMCRDVVEHAAEMNGLAKFRETKKRAQICLEDIGPRTSPREPWEGMWPYA